MIKASGKVYDRVKKLLEEQGADCSTLKICTFGRGGSYRTVILNDRPVGEYECNSRSLSIHDLDIFDTEEADK